MSEAIDTHGLTLDFGKHRGQLWTRVPVGYLRWLVNGTDTGIRGAAKNREIAAAELKRRGIDAADRTVEISGHAIDSASLRIRKLWHEDRTPTEGLHAWLLRICGEALEAHDPDDEGRIHWKGIRLVFEIGALYPVLKTVMRVKEPVGAPNDNNNADDDRPPWEE